MSGWGVSILFDTLYLNVEHTVSDHISGYYIFRDPRNIKCLCPGVGVGGVVQKLLQFLISLLLLKIFT